MKNYYSEDDFCKIFEENFKESQRSFNEIRNRQLKSRYLIDNRKKDFEEKNTRVNKNIKNVKNFIQSTKL